MRSPQSRNRPIDCVGGTCLGSVLQAPQPLSFGRPFHHPSSEVPNRRQRGMSLALDIEKKLGESGRSSVAALMLLLIRWR